MREKMRGKLDRIKELNTRQERLIDTAEAASRDLTTDEFWEVNRSLDQIKDLHA